MVYGYPGRNKKSKKVVAIRILMFMDRLANQVIRYHAWYLVFRVYERKYPDIFDFQSEEYSR